LVDDIKDGRPVKSGDTSPKVLVCNKRRKKNEGEPKMKMPIKKEVM